MVRRTTLVGMDKLKSALFSICMSWTYARFRLKNRKNRHWDGKINQNKREKKKRKKSRLRGLDPILNIAKLCDKYTILL